MFAATGPEVQSGKHDYIKDLTAAADLANRFAQVLYTGMTVRTPNIRPNSNITLTNNFGRECLLREVL